MLGGNTGYSFGSAKGVVRMVQVDHELCVIDGTIDGLSPGPHGLHVHECGDLSKGCDRFVLVSLHEFLCKVYVMICVNLIYYNTHVGTYINIISCMYYTLFIHIILLYVLHIQYKFMLHFRFVCVRIIVVRNLLHIE